MEVQGLYVITKRRQNGGPVRCPPALGNIRRTNSSMPFQLRTSKPCLDDARTAWLKALSAKPAYRRGWYERDRKNEMEPTPKLLV